MGATSVRQSFSFLEDLTLKSVAAKTTICLVFGNNGTSGKKMFYGMENPDSRKAYFNICINVEFYSKRFNRSCSFWPPEEFSVFYPEGQKGKLLWNLPTPKRIVLYSNRRIALPIRNWQRDAKIPSVVRAITGHLIEFEVP